MKFYKAIVCSLLFVGLSAWPQTAQQSAGPVRQDTPAGQTKIDPAKEADIRRMMELSGAAALAQQTMDSMMKDMKPLITSSLPPGEYREKLVDLFVVKIHSKADVNQLVDAGVQIYDKYFSHEEIKGLIQFYQTPVGQKMLSVLPKLTAEIMESGKQWGQQLGEQCMREVLAEHPDLKSALIAAGEQQQQ